MISMDVADQLSYITKEDISAVTQKVKTFKKLSKNEQILSYEKILEKASEIKEINLIGFQEKTSQFTLPLRSHILILFLPLL